MISALLLATMMADAPKPPVVTERARGDFFKAQLRLVRAAAEQQAAQDNFTAVLDKMCDKNSQPQIDGQGEPICVAKIPVVNAAPAKKPSAAPAPPSAPEHK